MNFRNKRIKMSRCMYKMQRERGWARENVHVMRLPAERLKVKCRVSLAVLGHPTPYISLRVFVDVLRCIKTYF